MKLSFDINQKVELEIPQELCNNMLQENCVPESVPAEIAERCREVLEGLAAEITQRVWDVEGLSARIEASEAQLDEYRFTANMVMGLTCYFDFDGSMQTYNFLNADISDCCYYVMKEWEVDKVYCTLGKTRLWRNNMNGESGWLLAVSEGEHDQTIDEFEFTDELVLLDKFRVDIDSYDMLDGDLEVF